MMAYSFVMHGETIVCQMTTTNGVMVQDLDWIAMNSPPAELEAWFRLCHDQCRKMNMIYQQL